MKLFDIIDSKDLTVKWNVVEKLPQFINLKNAQQNPKWHSEGNAFIHTRMVVESMYKLCPYSYPESTYVVSSDHSYYDRLILVAAALFHDIGKGETTKWNEEKGSWSSPRHAIVGEQITRDLLWDEDFRTRELVCNLVRNHMKPVYMMEHTNPRKEIIRMSLACPIRLLYTLKTADCSGCIMEKEDNWKEQLEFFKELAIELDCFDHEFKFYNDYSKFKFFQKEDEEFPSELYDDTEFTIYVMIGIAGSGKSTYINNNLSDYPIVSRDIIRTEIGITKEGDKVRSSKQQESKVSERENELIKEYCRNKTSFIIDDMNIRRMFRDKTNNMVAPYNPKIVYVYVEAPSFEDNLERRKGQIDKNAIKEMRRYLDFPRKEECFSLNFDIQGKGIIYGSD